MNTALLLATSALAGFLVGFLLARNTWLTFEGRQARRDLRTILNLRSELERHIALYKYEKKRGDLLRGYMRKWRALAVQAGLSLVDQKKEEVFGKSIFRDPALLAIHNMRQQIREPIPGSLCWKCEKPATTRLGDSMYCEDCVGQRAAP